MADFATKTGTGGTPVPNTYDSTPALTDRFPITGGKETSIEDLISSAITSAAIGANATVLDSGIDAVPVTIQNVIRSLAVTPQMFGATGLAADDQTAAMTKWAAAVSASGIGIIPPGVYNTSEDIVITHQSPTIKGIGFPTINMTNGIANRYGFILGRKVITDPTEGGYLALTSDITIGGNTIGVASSTGYRVGEWVIVCSKQSSVSSTGNHIPIRKQAFRIRDKGTGFLTVASTAERDFLVSDGACISAPGVVVAGATLSGFKLTNPYGSNMDYMHFVYNAVNSVIDNVHFDGWSSNGACNMAYGLTYRDCRFSGYGSVNTARGSMHVSFIRCFNIPRDTFKEAIAIFVEECSESVNFIGGEYYGDVRLSGNIDSERTCVKIRDALLDATIQTGNCPIVALSSANPNGFALDIQNCLIKGASYTGQAGVATFVEASYINSIRLVNNIFVGIQSTDVLVSGAGLPGVNMRAVIDGNINVGKGVHSSWAPYIIGNSETKLAATVGSKYYIREAEGSRQKWLWNIPSLPASTITLFSSSIYNGEHLAELRIHQSDAGKSASYSATISMTYDTSPTVVVDGAGLNGISVGITNSTSTTLQIQLTTTATSNLVVELVYWSQGSPTITTY